MTTDMELTALKACYRRAQKSPDKSSQNAAVLLSRNGSFMHTGTLAMNEFPRGVEMTTERWERPLKYSFVEHAERNAIYAAAKLGINTNGATMVCPWAACADCARAIVQSGIIRLVRHSAMDNTPERWRESVGVGDRILLEGGVTIYEDASPEFGFKVLRDGELLCV